MPLQAAWPVGQLIGMSTVASTVASARASTVASTVASTRASADTSRAESAAPSLGGVGLVSVAASLFGDPSSGASSLQLDNSNAEQAAATLAIRE
jgi:hypothetical protein